MCLLNSLLFITSTISIQRISRRTRICRKGHFSLRSVSPSFKYRRPRAALDASFADSSNEAQSDVGLDFESPKREGRIIVRKRRGFLWALLFSSVIESTLVVVAAVIGVVHANLAKKPQWGAVAVIASVSWVIIRSMKNSVNLYCLMEKEVNFVRRRLARIEIYNREKMLSIEKGIAGFREKLETLREVFKESEKSKQEIRDLRNRFQNERQSVADLTSKNRELEGRVACLEKEKQLLDCKVEEISHAERSAAESERSARAELTAVSAQLERMAESHTKAQQLEGETAALRRRLRVQEKTIQELSSCLDDDAVRIRRSQLTNKVPRRRVDSQGRQKSKLFWSSEPETPSIFEGEASFRPPEYYPPKEMSWPHSPVLQENQRAKAAKTSDKKPKQLSFEAENSPNLYNFSRGEFADNRNRLAPTRNTSGETVPAEPPRANAEAEDLPGDRSLSHAEAVPAKSFAKAAPLPKDEEGAPLSSEPESSVGCNSDSQNGSSDSRSRKDGVDLIATEGNQNDDSLIHPSIKNELEPSAAKPISTETQALITRTKSVPPEASSVNPAQQISSDSGDAKAGYGSVDGSFDKDKEEDRAERNIKKESLFRERKRDDSVAGGPTAMQISESSLISSAKEHLREARRKEASQSESEELFAVAVAKLKKALEVSNRSATSLFEYGVALLAWAKLNLCTEWAGDALEEARVCFEEAWGLKPGDEAILFNRGLTASLLAALKETAEAETLYGEACAHYENLLEMNSSSRSGAFNCGLAYFSRARLAESTPEFKKAASFYQKAKDYFMTSKKFNPEDGKTEKYLTHCQNALDSLDVDVL